MRWGPGAAALWRRRQRSRLDLRGGSLRGARPRARSWTWRRGLQHRRGKRVDEPGAHVRDLAPARQVERSGALSGGPSRTRSALRARCDEAPARDRLGSGARVFGGPRPHARLVPAKRALVEEGEERRVPTLLRTLVWGTTEVNPHTTIRVEKPWGYELIWAKTDR